MTILSVYRRIGFIGNVIRFGNYDIVIHKINHFLFEPKTQKPSLKKISRKRFSSVPDGRLLTE